MAQDSARYLGFLRQDIPKPVTVTAEGVLQFQIEVCSFRPSRLPLYVGAGAAELAAFGFADPGGDEAERCEQLYAWLAERVLTFHIVRRLIKHKTAYVAEGLAVHPFDAEQGDVCTYECVPLVTPEMAAGSLEEALRQGLPLRGFVPPLRDPGLPLLVVANGEFRGPFARIEKATRGYTLSAGLLGPGRTPAVADGLTVIADRGAWFVERRRYDALVRSLREGLEPPAVRSVPAAVAASAAAAAFAAPPALAASPGPPGPTVSEQAFLQRLQAAASAAGLYFPAEELLAFHTALKTGSLVVLAGLSGTGKSSLIDIYRRALGLPAGSHFLWLAVRPGWDDDADLIGYYDPLSRVYRPGETGLVDLLCRAQQQPEELFLVCFDEMNLARVEHYFAQFLSLLERPADQRLLRLYAPELAAEVGNRDRYPPQVAVAANVLFCGTINVDESSHPFSDKVLDRTNLIHLSQVDLKRWWEQSCRLAGPAAEAAATGSGLLPAPVSAATWRRWSPPLDPRPYGTVIDLLQALDDALGSAGADFRFGYRVAQQVLLYLHRVPRDGAGQPLLSPADALDQQVCQRILTKVRGASEDLLPLFKPGGPLATLLEASTLSQFRLSRAEIARKHRELDRHDFTV